MPLMAHVGRIPDHTGRRQQKAPAETGAREIAETIMTHYPVFVICRAGQDPEELLAPYEEYGARGTITKHATWQDDTEDVLESWESGTQEFVVTPDGELKLPWDDMFRVPGTYGIGGGTHEAPEDYRRLEIPYKDLYGTLDNFATKYYGHKPIPDQPGRYGYIHNSKGYWDWYVLGGRWRGGFADSDTFKSADWNGKTPQAIVTPDGEWHARGTVGWFGYWGGEEEQSGWEQQVKACLAAHPDCKIHNFDLHT